MAEPNQQSVKSTPEFLLDESELLTPEEQAALDAEQATEPEAEPLPETLPAKQPPQQPAPQQAEAAPEAPPKKEPPKHVPYDRFREVNEKAKTLEAELQAQRERLARLDERAQMAREAEERARQQPAQPIEIPTKLGTKPDAAIDPIGADLWDAKREAEIARFEAAEARAGNTQVAEQVQATRQQQEFANWVNNDAQQYRAAHPDYDQATQHAYNFRVEYWKGLGLDDARARQIVDQEAVATAMLARQNGKSAADTFYGLAQKVGYQQGNGNPQAPVPVQPEVQPAQGKERMRQVREGQKFQGLSRVPAENPQNVDWTNIGAQEIADMGEDEFLERLADPVQGPQLRKALQRLEMGQ